MNLKSITKQQWLIFLGVYFLAAGASFGVFSYSGVSTGIMSPTIEEEVQDGTGRSKIVFEGDLDQECPINGAMYTEKHKSIWEERRPLMVMIENHDDSRPQSGLSRADVVYEAIAEGGITRFMGVYYCKASEPASREYDLGPVRSARTYFLDWASEYSEYPLYAHVGGANCSAPEGGACTTDPRAQALEQIGRYGWLNRDHWSDLSQMALPYSVCRREESRTGESRATEHTMYCDTNALWETAEERGLDSWEEKSFDPWEFKDDEESFGDVKNISFDFWEGYKDYSVSWEFDPQANSYKRSNGGEVQIDFLTQEPLSARVVLVQFVKETGPVDDHKHMLYGTTGTGKILVFQDGEVVQGSWEKDERLDRTKFFDKSGKELELNRGLVWIEVLPVGSEVDYESE